MKRIMAIFLVLMFLIPVSVLASISQQTMETQQKPSISVGDVINGEAVVWVASNVNSLGENDVAYLTAVTTSNDMGGGLFWRMFTKLQRIMAYNQNNLRQFEDTAISRFSFTKNTLNSPWYCVQIINLGSYAFIWNKGYWSFDGPIHISSYGINTNIGWFEARQNCIHSSTHHGTVMSGIGCDYQGCGTYYYDYYANT